MDDYYCVEELSDHEAIDSSDDEDFKSLFTCLDSGDDEDFETEMERERQSHVNGVHKHVEGSTDVNTNGHNDGSKAKDIDAEAESIRNDHLFYDPTSDDNDQKWVDSQRPKTPTKDKGDQNVPNLRPMSSDATLNCPACMTLLCRDCQRHEIYRTQYRAMFVLNCRIDFTEKLELKGKEKKRRKTDDRDHPKGVDSYYPVFCEQCNTQVAVYDHQEVYHFFSVLASF